MERYDAIAIGSGMGGLTTAAIMARLKGWRVLVLERHFRAGGFTHTFKRPGGWEWDVGLHYVGQMEPRSTGRRLFDFITAGAVRWNPMPDSYDRFVYPDFEFPVPKGEENYRAALTGMFPRESAAIHRYFRDVRTAAGYHVRHLMANSMPLPMGAALRWCNRLGSKMPLTTTGEYLDRHFSDARLKALLASQWADYGLPPAKSAFATHALIVTHYMQGAWYPEGGAGTIAEAAGNVIRAAGGEILVNHEVRRILLEDNRAVGVEAVRQRGKDGETVRFEAPVVISDAGAWTTFRKLLPDSLAAGLKTIPGGSVSCDGNRGVRGRREPPERRLQPGLAAPLSASESASGKCEHRKRSIENEGLDRARIPFRDELEPATEGFTAATLYLGLNGDPRQLGFQGENHWIFDGLDHDAMYAKQDDLPRGQAHVCYLSFPSLKNPRATAHTAEIIAPLSYGALQQFREEPWRRRSAQYQELKTKIAETLLAMVERHHPGFSRLVEYQEVSTPLTTEHFTGHRGGSSYGYPATPERFGKTWLAPSTAVRNLYLTGADAGSLGIMGAMMGGVSAAARLLGPVGFLRIVAAASRKPEAPGARAIWSTHS
jgi:all-trans-retinol 13,14-reductase